MPMPSLIEEAVASWIASGDADNAASINNGLCADFATVFTNVSGAEIVGVYDVDDLQSLRGGFTKEFCNAVRADWIGHTAILFHGKYFDSEAVNGVLRFEDLPVNQRAMQ